MIYFLDPNGTAFQEEKTHLPYIYFPVLCDFTEAEICCLRTILITFVIAKVPIAGIKVDFNDHGHRRIIFDLDNVAGIEVTLTSYVVRTIGWNSYSEAEFTLPNPFTQADYLRELKKVLKEMSGLVLE